MSPPPIMSSNPPHTANGVMYALAISVLPSCQKPIEIIINITPATIKSFDEKISSFAHCEATLRISIMFSVFQLLKLL